MAILNNTQPSFSSGIISTELFGRIDFNKLESGLKQCENWFIRPAGGAVYRTGTKYISGAKYDDKSVSLIPFVYNRGDGLCLEFGEQYIRFYKDGEQITVDGEPYEITTTYGASEVQSIKFVQDKNKMYLVHPNHPPALLERKSDTEWSLRDLVFNPDVPTVESVTIKANVAKNPDTVVTFSGWQYAVSCVDKDGHEGMPVYSNIVASDIDLLNQTMSVSFTVDNDKMTNIDRFNIYRIKGGEFFRCYVQDRLENAETQSLTDISFALDETKSPKEKFTAFDGGEYPSAVGYWNQRLLLGCTNKKPNTFWGSRVGYPEDFTSTFVLADDEGFELTFNSGSLDSITDFITMDDLIVFTEGKIWRVTGTAVSNMAAYVESYTGSSGIRPYVSKKSILFIDSTINTVSNFVYSYELNGYAGQNLDILARDNFDGYTLKDISFRDTPYGVLYAVRSDGVLMCLTYMREENIYAWHKYTTQGYFRAVCNVDKNENDQVYVVVERDGHKYIELFQNEINAIQGINDSWHLDCAGRYFSNWQEWGREGTIPSETYYGFVGAQKTGSWYCWQLGWTHFPEPTVIKVVEGYIYTKTPNPSDDDYWSEYYIGGNGLGELTKDESKLVKRTTFSFIKQHWTLLDGNIYGASWRSYRRYKAGDFSYSDNPPYDVLYTNNKVSGGLLYKRVGDEFEKVGAISSYNNDTITYDGFTYNYDESKNVVSGGGSESIKLYTVKNPTISDLAYSSPNGTQGQTIEDVQDDYILVNGEKYYKINVEIEGLSSISGLERFNGHKVTILADGNVYPDILVENGEIVLPRAANNVLVGYSYDGIIETIPLEKVFSSGNSTVGYNRRITELTLSYYKTRGLWYGRSIDNLYEIKPYKEKDFSDEIPLESGKLTLKVKDDFDYENGLFVVQKSPLPALLQSITLRGLLNGGN